MTVLDTILATFILVVLGFTLRGLVAYASERQRLRLPKPVHEDKAFRDKLDSIKHEDNVISFFDDLGPPPSQLDISGFMHNHRSVEEYQLYGIRRCCRLLLDPIHPHSEDWPWRCRARLGGVSGYRGNRFHSLPKKVLYQQALEYLSENASHHQLLDWKSFYRNHPEEEIAMIAESQSMGGRSIPEMSKEICQALGSMLTPRQQLDTLCKEIFPDMEPYAARSRFRWYNRRWVQTHDEAGTPVDMADKAIEKGGHHDVS